MAQVVQGKMTLAEAIAKALGDKHQVAKVKPEVPTVIPITDEHRRALKRIVEVYGKVTPTEPRLLTPSEQQALLVERDTIGEILKLLKDRKEVSLRETIANHLDRVAEEKRLADEDTRKDARGHYALKQDEPVPDTDQKFQRILVEPKPEISGAVIQALHEAGKIDRADYLAITRMPLVKRSFDQTKASEAITKDPGLLFRIAAAVTQAPPTTTIKTGKA
jgi:hypothetical protein